MAAGLKRIKRSRYGRVLLCMLIAAVFLSQWTAAAGAETEIAAMNASGSWNTAVSVDPIKKTEGFAAILYNNRSGLPTSDANAIAQTGEGFLWIGSYAGLIRYDGNTFDRIDSTDGIANVRCLFVDSHDCLWIGTNDSGVFLMKQGEFRKWDKADGLRSVSIRAIAEDENGFVYVAGAAAGIAVIDADLRLSVLQDARVDGLTIPVLRRGSDGLIYGLTQNGDLFTLMDGELVTFLSHEECRVKDIHSILPDPVNPGRLYLGTENSEVYSGDLSSNFASLGRKDISPLSGVNSMEFINGQIWLCTGNGIGRLDNEGFHVLRNVPMNNSVENVLTDYEGNLWFASSHQGVMKIVRSQFSDLFERYDLPAAVVNSTCLYGRQLFIGTDSGLIVIEGDKRADSIPLTKAATASGESLETDDLLEYLDGVRVRSIVRDSKGRLWIPTWRRYGLLCYDQGELTVYSREDGLFSDSIRVTCECEDGSILVANKGGVSVIRDERVVAGYGEADGIVNGEILTVTEGFHHEIILGSDGDGIYIVGPDGIKRIGEEDGLRSEIILRIKRSQSRELYWIVTGNSLACMTPDYQVKTIQHFPYPNNYDLYENSKGDLWILSSAGIYVVPEKELLEDDPIDLVFYGLPSGLPYVASANSRSELTAEGDLYIASSEGVVKVNIEKPFENIGDLKIALPFIDADDERYYPDPSGKFYLPANAQKLTIFPYLFSYSLIDPQVSYRLEGFDQTDETLSRSKLLPLDYTNLKIGSYTFSMTVRDPVGHGEQTASFPIIIGKEMSLDTVGTIVMLASSLLLMSGILINTSLYRRRGRLADRLFFGLIITNLVMVIGEALSYLLEFSIIPLVRELMIAGNTAYYVALVFFPCLLLVYLDCAADSAGSHGRRRMLLYGIPFALFCLFLIANLKTGWLFSIREGNVFHAGRYSMLAFYLVGFYLLLSLVIVFRLNKRLGALGVLLIATRLLWGIWIPGISSISFFYTLIIVCILLYMMNRQPFEEVS